MLERISRFQIGRLIGVGGMGEVYLASDSTLGRNVALKLLPERFTGDEERVSRFQREARAASALNHPNIITVFDFGQAERRHYIVTEYIEGETLRSRIIDRPLSVAEVLDVAIGVASALAAAHEAGIIHRDIKPENVMLRPDGYVKVLDFGLAKLVESELPPLQSDTGSVMGTLLYLSPEQARGFAPDHRSDLYSLGAVIFEMLTRQPPVVSDNFVDLAMAIVTRQPPRPSKLREDVPPELDRIVLKALAKNREQRYQSAGEMLADLREMRQQLEFEGKLSELAGESDYDGLPLTQQPTVRRSLPHHGTLTTRIWRSPKKLFAVIAIVLAIAGTIGYSIFRGSIGGSSGAIDSIAVLPFTNASADPATDYLSVGISDSIADSLSQLPQLQVAARTSSSRHGGARADPVAAGREMRVRAVVSGEVLQRGDSLVIHAALTDVKRGTQIWGQSYVRRSEDVLAVQQDMARKIAEKLQIPLTGKESRLLSKRKADNSEAFQLYLKGRYFRQKFEEAAIRKSVGYFNQAIEIDPTYAQAYAGLADAYFGLSNLYMAPREAMPRVREAARRALALDDSLAEAHTSLALVEVWYDWNFAAGEREFRRAIELNPGDEAAHRLYGDFLTAVGRFEEALSEKRKAEQLDPLSIPAAVEIARTLFFAGRLEDAKVQIRRVLDLDENYGYAFCLLGWIEFERHEPQAAIENVARALAIRRSPLYITLWGYLNAKSGHPEVARQAIAELQQRPSYTLPLYLARLEAGLGNHDAAIQWLNRSYDDRSESMLWLKVDPSFRPLRSDPRFIALMRKIGV